MPIHNMGTPTEILHDDYEQNGEPDGSGCIGIIVIVILFAVGLYFI